MITLIASKPLGALQCRQGFLNPLNRLCGRFSWLVQAHMHSITHVCRRSKETDSVSLAWDLQTQVANLCRQLLILELLKPWRPDSTFVATKSVTRSS